MTVGLLPEHTASRIVAIQGQLDSHDITPETRERLTEEQSKLWDEAFPGKPFEEIKAIVAPFLLAA
jgi:hypothetical protein